MLVFRDHPLDVPRAFPLLEDLKEKKINELEYVEEREEVEKTIRCFYTEVRQPNSRGIDFTNGVG